MKNSYISTTLLIVVLIFVQVLFLNNIRVFTYFIPLVYLYPILKLTARTAPWITILLGALIGFVVDMFMNTPGLNMAATTLVAYLRKPIIRVLFSDELEKEEEDFFLSFYTVKGYKYLIYIFLLTLLHITSLLLLEAFSLSLYRQTLPYILGSIVISVPFMMVLDALGGFRKSLTHARPKKF